MSPKPNLHSLQARFTLLICVVAVLFGIVAAPLMYTLGYREAIARDRVILNSLVTAVEKTAAAAAYTGDKLLLQEVVEGLGRNPMVARAELRNETGNDVRYVRSAAPDTSSQLIVERPLASPFDPHETVGTLRLEASRAQVEGSARRDALTAVLFMALMLLVIVAVLYTAAQFYISRPIVNLARQLHAMVPGTSLRLPVPAYHGDDEIGVLVSSANAVLDSNELALTEERRLLAEVAAMEAQYRKIFDSTSAGIFVLDPGGHLINANPTVFKLIGVPVQQMRQLRNEDFIRLVFACPERVTGMIEEAARSGQTVSADLELMATVPSLARWVHCLISVQAPREAAPGGGVADTTEGVIYDITDRKQHERRVRFQADHDSLTGLWNRAATEAAIDHALAEARQRQSRVSLLYIDLDGFKDINDANGHDVGDLALRECARRMLDVVRRSTDIVGRIGGDEFVVMLDDCGIDDEITASVAAGLLAALRRPIALGNTRALQVGASIGIAGFPHHGDSLRELMLAADSAMYAVKRNGKNAVAVAAPDFGRAA
jgi:diguanylate cyclase (GGDEF)-like protein